MKFHVLSAWLRVVRTISTAGESLKKVMVMVWPAPSEVPVTVADTPLVEPESIVTTGGAVSTVKIWVNKPALPPPSVTLATMACSPSLSEKSSATARLQAPPPSGTG